MKLYLIRHAESANNALLSSDESNNGRTPDPEITDVGHAQSEKLGQFLATSGNEPRQHPRRDTKSFDFGISHLYCSLMTRSILTANYIAQSCHIVLKARDDIFERKGLYEVDATGNATGVAGPGRSYFENRFPALILPQWVDEKGWWNRPLETDAQFIQRAEISLRSIIEEHQHTDENVAIVVHGDYIDQCINSLFSIPRKPQNYSSHWEANWVSHNTSISRIDIENRSSNIVYLNRIDHLTPGLITW
ncbi:MAG: hypothetical protein GKR96_10790 [Gammaproteobacteria bacterium]|nr:hypothetical protein [Gammaproteobacteria bacterium]